MAVLLLACTPKSIHIKLEMGHFQGSHRYDNDDGVVQAMCCYFRGLRDFYGWNALIQFSGSMFSYNMLHSM